MKRLIITMVVCLLAMASCAKEELIEANKEEVSFNEKTEEEETHLITKVSATFNKMVQDKELLYALKNIDETLLLGVDTIKDDVLPSGIFEDNVMMFSGETIRDDLIIGRTSFETVFEETYAALYKEEMQFDVVLGALPKLYFGVPKTAFEDYGEWLEKGAVIYVQSYDNTTNSLQQVSKEKLIGFLGKEYYGDFEQALEGTAYDTFYIDEVLGVKKVIAKKGDAGKVMVIEEGKNAIVDFKINDEGSYDTVSLVLEKEEVTFYKERALKQVYVDIVNPYWCNQPYAFKCGSVALQNFLAEKQAWANKTCQTYTTCLPLCCHGGIIYAMFVIEPTAIRCAVAQQYISVLSKM